MFAQSYVVGAVMSVRLFLLSISHLSKGQTTVFVQSYVVGAVMAVRLFLLSIFLPIIGVVPRYPSLYPKRAWCIIGH